MSTVYEPIDRFSPERAELLAKLIEGLPKAEFDMQQFAHPCGTPSCIAGWAASLLDRSVKHADAIDLQLFLGCTLNDANWLTYGYFRTQVPLCEITPAEAAAAIRQTAEILKTTEATPFPEIL